jgi:acetolactate decarboxylase
MVILEGEVFQICEDGSARQRLDDRDLPFAQVCHFTSPHTCSFRDIADLGSLEEACDSCRLSNNLFFAFRINATFESIHARTVKTTKDGSSLESAGNNEVKFTWYNISGSLLGFWSPAFASSFSVPGYHFHFISEDRATGGHVLDCSFARASSHVQVLNVYEVALPRSGSFLETDLSIDARAILQKVE